MQKSLIAALAFLAASPAAAAQQAPPLPAVIGPPAQAAPALTAPDLDQLTGPIALYPDPLLANVLAAATYPLEVVQAHRWISQPENVSLSGDVLATLAAGQDWDPSVQALLPFPDVLAMMDDHLDWTERLGEAFLAQPGDVMDSIQRMRQHAHAAGSLAMSPEQSVVNDGPDIAIEPSAPQEIYVPNYDPWCAYGPSPYGDAPSYFEPTPPVCGEADDSVSYDTGTYLPYAFGIWGFVDWRHHHVHVHHFGDGDGRGGDGPVWHHDPTHRIGTPYRDARNAAHFPLPRAPESGFHYYAGPAYAHGFGFERPQAINPVFRAPGPMVRPVGPVAAPHAVAAPHFAAPAGGSFGFHH
jgi:hypothetical protein